MLLYLEYIGLQFPPNSTYMIRARMKEKNMDFLTLDNLVPPGRPPSADMPPIRARPRPPSSLYQGGPLVWAVRNEHAV